MMTDNDPSPLTGRTARGEEQTEEGIRVRLEFQPDEDVRFPLAQNVWINHDEGHFYLRFYQVVPPLAREGLPDSIKAKLVATVAIPATAMPSLIRALTSNAHNYESLSGRQLLWASDEEG